MNTFGECVLTEIESTPVYRAGPMAQVFRVPPGVRWTRDCLGQKRPIADIDGRLPTHCEVDCD
jgi:hypothetical protein